MSRILMILFPEKESDTKHVCYEGGCSLFTKGQGGLCHQLWSTPPKHLKGKMACMCNFYDTMSPTIVEADNMDINDAIARVQGAEYIRKDALLEWAKEQKTLMELGGHVSIDDVIDKLNSM